MIKRNCSSTILFLGFAFLISIAFTSTAVADPFSISTADGTVGADAYVKRNDGNNHGTETQVYTKNNGANNTTRKGYIRFDTSGIAAPYVDSALDLTFTLNNQGGNQTPVPQTQYVNVYGLRDGVSGESWGESTIIWSNAPGQDPSNYNDNRMTEDAIFLGRFTVPANATPDLVSVDLPAITTFLNTDTNGSVTLMTTRENSNGSWNLGYAAKEHATQAPPTLSGTTESATQIQTVTTAFGSGADAYVRGGSNSGNNYGASGNITIKNGGNSSYLRKGYLRFDLTDVDSEIFQAGVMFDVTTRDGGEHSVNVFGLLDGAGDFWDESTMTWDDAPANAGGDSLVGSEVVALGSFIVPDDPAGGSVIFSSDELTDFLNDDTNDLASLILVRDSSNSSWNLAFSSKENSTYDAPMLLMVTAAAVPEPATFALWAILGACGIGYCRLRRRK